MTTSLNSDTWIIRPKHTYTRLRLFCFPYAGGGASIFRPWLGHLPSEIEICLIQLPGREDRLMEPAPTQLYPLVSTLMHILQPYLDMPFAFFGHSVGSLLSFELARHLHRQKNIDPERLFVSACPAPQIPRTGMLVHEMLDVDLIDKIRDLNGTHEEILQNEELLQLMLPLLRADFSLSESYVYHEQEPLKYPISAFGGLQDEKVSKSQIAEWRMQTSNFFNLRMLPGNHFFLHTSRDLLLQGIKDDLTPFLDT